MPIKTIRPRHETGCEHAMNAVKQQRGAARCQRNRARSQRRTLSENRGDPQERWPGGTSTICPFCGTNTRAPGKGKARPGLGQIPTPRVGRTGRGAQSPLPAPSGRYSSALCRFSAFRHLRSSRMVLFWPLPIMKPRMQSDHQLIKGEFKHDILVIKLQENLANSHQ